MAKKRTRTRKKTIAAAERSRHQHVVTNRQDQPLELHLTAGVVIVPAQGSVTLQEHDVAAPQIEALRRQRLLDIQQVDVPVPTSAETEPAPAPAAAVHRTRARKRRS